MELVEDSIFAKPPVIYASFWGRFGAAIIDGIIIGIPMTIINWSLFHMRGFAPTLINIVVAWLYDALQESGPNRATVGKKAMGIQVTDLEGNRITFMQATGRHFGKYISAVILAIGYFMMLWDDKSQTLHDKMAGTLVIKNI